MTIRLTLFSRSYCHLCEDMAAAVRAFMARAGVGYQLDIVDVDADPALVARYDELVPVLAAGADQVELCHYFLDETALAAHLSHAMAGASNGPRPAS
ncbi:glutaredoxin family protein [Massilia sp. YIM B02763]|uniref:glutaredoxin family protein n=1 Tax=Massilia sp. YIM B02763 TaxID=3050130 RepID=UPI0025B63365|nr:glutaredoxin family protein [Massilia sp. YIM B02763]